MRVCAVALLVLVSAASAHAGADVGVVTGGDPMLQKQVAAHVQGWLEAQGHQLVATPLSKDAQNTLANCFVLDDLKCARGVFDARTKSFILVYVGVDVDGKKLTLTVYWFVKGRDPNGAKEVCEACDGDAWHAAVDAMLQRLSASTKVEMGRVAVHSQPAGVSVLLDDVNIGATPIERDLPAGKHTVTLTHRGRTVGTREVDVAVGQTSELAMTVDLDTAGERPSRMLPIVLLAGGVVTAAAGGVMIYKGSQDDASHKRIYPELVPGGIVLTAVGGAAIIGGAILLVRASRAGSAPVALAGPHGAYLGWVGRF